MDKDMMKINDDELENVSGGSYDETQQLCEIIKIGPEAIKKILKKIGIVAVFNEGLFRNMYKDEDTGKTLTHEEVIKRLKEHSDRGFK